MSTTSPEVIDTRAAVANPRLVKEPVTSPALSNEVEPAPPKAEPFAMRPNGRRVLISAANEASTITHTIQPNAHHKAVEHQVEDATTAFVKTADIPLLTEQRPALPSPNYTIGYCKPPKHSRFKKGKSGNSKGRPRHAKNLKTILEEEINAIVTFTENGKTTKASKTQLAIKSAINKAVKGDLKALQFITKLMENLSPQSLQNDDSSQKHEISNLSAIDREILEAFGMPLPN